MTGANFNDVKAGRAGITEAQQNALFKFDLDKHVAQVRSEISNFDKLPLKAKIVLTDMTFNLGSLSAFNDLKEAIGRMDYRQAAYDIGHKSRDPNSPPSNYADQVGKRAARNIALMEEVATEAKQ